MEDDLYICCEVPNVRVAANQRCVLPVARPPALLDENGLKVAPLCDRVDTLANHADRLMGRFQLAEAERPNVTRDLRRLVELGLLVSWRQLARPAGDPALKIETLAVLTRNRPQGVGRCLRSHVEHFAAFGRPIDLVVVDSSPDPDGQKATEQMASQAGGRLHYAAEAEKAAFVERLAATAQIDPQLVGFALEDPFGCGHDIGANRNAILLGLAGHPFLSSDDDVVCQPHGYPDAAGALRVTTGDHSEIQLHESASAARDATPPWPGCLLDDHEALLGRPVSGLLAARPLSQISFEGTVPALIRLLGQGSARVAATTSGLVGDSGAKFPAFYLWKRSVREQVIDLPADAYARLVESRQVVRTARIPTITTAGHFMAGHVALDGRSLLPPFFPILRGEDLTFGRALRACGPGDLIAHVGSAILHLPLHSRIASIHQLWPEPSAIGFASVMEACLARAALGLTNATPGAPRLQLLGRQIAELAGLPAADFTATIRKQLLDGASGVLIAHEQMLQGLPAASPWARDLRAFLPTLIQQLTAADPAAPMEMVERWGAARAPALTRELIARFGELLQAWPALFASARELNRAGRGLWRGVGAGPLQKRVVCSLRVQGGPADRDPAVGRRPVRGTGGAAVVPSAPRRAPDPPALRKLDALAE